MWIDSCDQSAKRHLSSRIDRVDSNLDECKELTVATKDEVKRSLANFILFALQSHQAIILICI